MKNKFKTVLLENSNVYIILTLMAKIYIFNTNESFALMIPLSIII